MTSSARHVAKHVAPRRRAATPPRRLLRTGLVSAVAVLATGATVAGGLVAASGEGGAPAGPVAAVASPMLAAADLAGADEVLAERTAPVTRSDRRAVADPAQSALLDEAAGGGMTRTEDLADSDARSIGRALLAEFGFGSDQWTCLERLWTKESNWRWNAANPTSSAYGIPQSLPGSKMASAGSDWRTNPVTQIRWGLGYIQGRYGTPCAAWGHSQRRNWY